MLDDIPDNLLSPAQKNDAKAAIALYRKTAEARFAVFHGGHAAAAQRILGLIRRLPVGEAHDQRRGQKGAGFAGEGRGEWGTPVQCALHVDTGGK